MLRRNNGLILTSATAGKKPQPAAKGTKAATQKDSAASKDGQVASGVAGLKISDVPPPKSKGLDVVKEWEASTSKRSISFVVVGKSRAHL